MPTMTRRAALAAAAALPLSGARTAPRLPLDAGVELWTVKDDLDKDFEGVLRRIREIGYRRVEAAGYHGRTPQAFRAALDAAGLTCGAVHYSLGDLRQDLEGAIAATRVLGSPWLVSSSPYVTKPLGPTPDGASWMQALARVMTLEDWRENAELMARCATAAKAAGLRFAHHNHIMEFTPIGGVLPIEEVLRIAGPAGLRLELDVAWAAAAGADPVDFLRRHAGQVAILHLKDLRSRPGRGAPTDFQTVEVGSGVIDWPAVIAAARRAGVKAAYVEQEAPFARPPLVALKASYDYLSRLPA